MASSARKHIGEKNTAALHALCRLDRNQRKAILSTANAKLVKCICECALNVLAGNIPLKKHEKRKLKKHKQTLRKLAASHGTWKNKKRFIIQKGGFLPLLLAPIIGSLLSNIFSSDNNKRD